MESILAFSLLWARVALGLYLAGWAAALAASLLKDAGQQNAIFGLARAAVAAGFLFQFVSLVESVSSFTPQADVYRILTGLLALIIAAFFLMVYRAWSPRPLSLVVLPLICLVAGAATLAPATAAGGPSPMARSLLHNGWIFLHIVLIFIGYAGLVVAVGSGLLYLIAERGLKSKRLRAPGRVLPSLEKLDLISYRSLLVGFPLLSAGLVIGIYWADALFGRVALGDPTVLLALLAWSIYLVLLFARWSAGWRGRRSAYLTLVCFGLAVAGWLANGMSQVHSMFLK